MSFFSWFMRKPSAQRRSPQPSGPLNAGASVSPSGRSHKPSLTSAVPEQAPATKNERVERRELLYIVVRDAMVCAGVLSASYKFKVLSLDPRGLQFLVMMDLAREFGGETGRLSEIETLIAQTAKARYNIAVTAVYWRINELVVTGVVRKGAPMPSAQQPTSTVLRAPDPPRPAPSPAAARPSMAAPLDRPSAAASVRLMAPRFDPIEADEVAAFKQALAAAAAARTSAAPTPGVPQRSGPRRPAPSSDFADTVMPEQDSRAQNLSNTQYGEL